MAWRLFRYEHDIAYYVYCDKCGQRFPTKISRDMPDRVALQIPHEDMLYPYCPSCGAHHERIFVDRNHYELYNFEGRFLKKKVKVIRV